MRRRAVRRVAWRRWWLLAIPLAWIAVMAWHGAVYWGETAAATRERTTIGTLVSATPWQGQWSGSRVSRPRAVSVTFYKFHYTVNGQRYTRLGTDPIYRPPGVLVFYDPADPAHGRLHRVGADADATLELIWIMAFGLTWIVAAVAARLLYVRHRARRFMEHPSH